MKKNTEGKVRAMEDKGRNGNTEVIQMLEKDGDKNGEKAILAVIRKVSFLERIQIEKAPRLLIPALME